MRILGPPSAPREYVLARIPTTAAPLFRDVLFPLLWDTAINQRHPVDPVGVVAQAAKETAWGKFGGRITAAWCNPCGLKIPDRMINYRPGVTDGDNPLAHAIFPSWRVGILAMVQHALGYAGVDVPAEELVDPRFELTRGKRCEDWHELGERWAPASDYGAKIEEIITRYGWRTT